MHILTRVLPCSALSAASQKAEHEKELVVKEAMESMELSKRERREIQKAAAESLEAALSNITQAQARADEGKSAISLLS